MLKQDKVEAIKRLEDELVNLRAEPEEETIIERDASIRAYRIFTSTAKDVAFFRRDGELLGLKEVLIPDWVFRETGLCVESPKS